jgi:superkiller protein 3
MRVLLMLLAGDLISFPKTFIGLGYDYKGLVFTCASLYSTDFSRNLDAVNSILGTALIYHRSPRYHQEALSIFRSILTRRPNFTPGLIGVGLILEESEDYAEAIKFLDQAFQRDRTNIRVGSEAAWCRVLNGEIPQGYSDLEKLLSQIDMDEPKSNQLKAQILYRIGVCMWKLDDSPKARKLRSGAYSRFLSAIKADVNYAPAYTSLGIYYEDYANDNKRARQCFQKAFELSGSELEAAERLARSFANQSDWDIVEAIAQRAIDSGKTKPAVGSKKKGVSWPYSALGFVQMNKQEYSKSTVSFLAALRIKPDDYNSYVGLGESYHNSGRYNSASRALRHAEHLDNALIGSDGKSKHWFTKYMLSNVNREIGAYDQAISGYRSVLDLRPLEFGVLIALMQTFVEKAWRCIETGFFGQAVTDALDAICIGESIIKIRFDSFGLWKALGDACSVFSWALSRADEFPSVTIAKILQQEIDVAEYDLFSEFDGVGQEELLSLSGTITEGSEKRLLCVEAAILAKKRAIYHCSHNLHAQAVAWYNLGWTEYRMYTCLFPTSHLTTASSERTKFLKTAVRCFKRAIELEAGNSEFWNALGVVTAQLDAKVAQHSFVRSLHLNEKDSKVWTNFGTLALMNNDLELAHSAFGRAQSIDPDYSHAWLGEGLVALSLGDTKESLSHFTHAFEISDSSSILVNRLYASAAFDGIRSSSSSQTVDSLIQPTFALRQLLSQNDADIPSQYLLGLLLERMHDHDAAISTLNGTCAAVEAEYEANEQASALISFAQAKAALSRNQLAADSYEDAVESAQTVLDITSDTDLDGMSLEKVQKIRLSAHLSAGLAHYYLKNMDGALGSFRSALEESQSAADVVCLLAQVLWAKGGKKEKNVAKEQLMNCVEENPKYMKAILLLGAISILESDCDTIEAVREDLNSLRAASGVSSIKAQQIEQLLYAIASLASDGSDEDLSITSEITTSIMLSPSRPYGWGRLAVMSEEPFPRLMALLTASRTVSLNGGLDAVDLSKAFAGSGSAGDGQRAVMLAPWKSDGWQSLAKALA